jgi:hypothetical protein
MIKTTFYHIPCGERTIVIMGAVRDEHEICLRIGLGNTLLPESVETRELPDLGVFRNYQMVLPAPFSFAPLAMEAPAFGSFDLDRVRFGEAERIRTSAMHQGIPHMLFAWFEHEGETRQCFSILVEKGRDALKCTTPRDEINIFESIERFFTPRVKGRDEE